MMLLAKLFRRQNHRRHNAKRRTISDQCNIESDDSNYDSAEAFVRIIDLDAVILPPIDFTDSVVNNVEQSFRSSISSRDSELLGKQFSKAVNKIPSNECSCDETKSISEAKNGSSAQITNMKELKRSGTLNVTGILKCRENLVQSINVLRCHVPRCVMRDLSKEVMRLQRNEQPKLVMPCVQTYMASLLFIDMKGFTQLSLLLDLESLSKAINSYFQTILDEVTNHGGDVLKFAGDAIFAEWRVRKSSGQLKIRKEQIDECVLQAAHCGAAVVAKCSDYPVFDRSDDGAQVATLNVHCGLAYGDMAALHVGHDFYIDDMVILDDGHEGMKREFRREFLVMGHSIDQVTNACNVATYGELMASPEACDILQRCTKMRQTRRNNEPVRIASRGERFFEKRNENRFRHLKRGSLSNSPQSHVQEYRVPFNNMDIASLKKFQQLLSSYVHPVVVSDSFRQDNPGNDFKVTEERHRAQAELRSKVYTIFIKPVLKTELTDNRENNEKIINLLNDTLNLVTSVLNTFKGHLRQYIIDDKGVILIATFGLRGTTTPNMASERVLPACRVINHVLHNDLGINNYIGLTLGQAYCGVVGGILRHEFAVLGSSVNLAARLLSMRNHPGILINDSVRREAIKWGNFLSFPRMNAKGYPDPVPVYQPLSARETRWGKANPRFVGRKDEMRAVRHIAQNMVEAQSPAHMFFVWAESGSGKSDFIVQTVAQIRKFIISMRKGVIVSRSIGTDGDKLVPFSAFRSIFLDLLADSRGVDGTSTLSSRISTSMIARNRPMLLQGRDWECDSTSMQSLPTVNSTSIMMVGERLKEICDKLGAPIGFLQIVGYHLLGHTKKPSITPKGKHLPNLDDIVNFMVKVFIHLTMNFDLTILALDDIHHTDNFSWKVVQRIYETGKGILIICGSRPARELLQVDDEFWKSLKGIDKVNKRFQELVIGPLDQCEISQMTAIALSCKVEELDVQFVKDIFDHTRGMPHFAAQALDICMRKGLCERLSKTNKFGWCEGTVEIQISSLDELLVQRIDDLDDFTRNTLHLASVLGHNFTLMDIIGLSEHVLSIQKNEKEEKEHSDKIRHSLNIAMEEGVLEFVDFGTESSGINYKEGNHTSSSFANFSEENSEEIEIEEIISSYRFCHDSWRQKILSQMLHSYKRDIHMHAAKSIELRLPNIEQSDYRTKMRLIFHFKESGSKSKSAELALSVGESFMHLGLNSHSIRVYDEALDIWRRGSVGDSGDDLIAGFSAQVLNSLDCSDLISIIMLQTALGQANATLERVMESARSFEDALEIFKKAPISKEIKDRSIVFPIYSGLFVLVKCGKLVGPEEENKYLHDLAVNFVEETKLHGDEVHYSRSLALQGEIYSLQGKYEEALSCHETLKRIYNVDKHSTLVIKSYNSDRAAQNFGISANCLYRLGRVEESLQLSAFILNKLMPNMPKKNLHNSIIMIYPILWILKNETTPRKALSALERFIFEPFHEYFGKESTTFALPLYEPLRVLFTLEIYSKGEIKTFDKGFIPWALEPDSLVISAAVDNSMSNFGRSGSSICAEICLLLAKYSDNQDIKKQLVNKGWDHVQIAMEIALKCGQHQTTYFETKPVYNQLQQMRIISAQ